MEHPVYLRIRAFPNRKQLGGVIVGQVDFTKKISLKSVRVHSKTSLVRREVNNIEKSFCMLITCVTFRIIYNNSLQTLFNVKQHYLLEEQLSKITNHN